MTRKALVLVLICVSTLLAQSTPKPFNSSPSRIVGQPAVSTLDSSSSPNIVEGKELWQPSSVAVDTSVSPPILYVSDTGNNRVLGWSNAVGFAAGDPASVVIGQRDMKTTYAKGPGTTLTRGLNTPTGIAVDSQGNLYVVDAGNNRILRYPKPMADPANPLNPDLVIGQADFTSKSANRGASSLGADGIYPYTAGGYIQQLAIDAAGNLWYTDTGNHRVLRFPKSGDSGKVATTADMVLGQLSMNTNTQASNGMDKTGLRYPTGLTTDASGRVYVSDALARVVVYVNPVAAGNTAVRVLGALVGPNPVRPNATEIGYAMGLTMLGSNLAVVDAGYHRVMVYDPYESWGAESASVPSPPAKVVCGQGSWTGKQPSAAANGFRTPFQATVANGELYVADAGNNRVVVYPQGLWTTGFGTAAAVRVIGQRGFGYSGANGVDGRGMFLSPLAISQSGGMSLANGGGVVVDTKSTPPRLYVADAYNHRILGYKDARNVRPNDTADLVIGQADFYSASINGALNDDNQRNETTLNSPAGMAVDANSDLWVADRGNGRVLRFPQPFAQTAGATQRANLVIGQRDFNDRNTDASDSNMAQPYGVAFMPEGHLLVSDAVHNRVLMFRKPSGGDFSNGMHAAAVFGQPDYYTTTAVTGVADRMAYPHGIAVDSSGRLYVSDMGGNRVVIYSQVGSGVPLVALILTNSTASAGLRSPIGVSIDPAGSIWVAELLGNGVGQVLRFPEFSVLQAMAAPLPDFALTPGNPSTQPMPPVALTTDKAGNLIVAEWGNRVSFYFPSLWTTSAGNYLPNVSLVSTYSQPCCSPGSIAVLWPFSTSGMFGQSGDVPTTTFNDLPNPVPLPKTLGDVQLTLKSADYPETAVPLYLVSPGQINFQVPKNAPVTGSLDVTLMKASTGQVLAAGTVSVKPVAPAFLTNGFPIGTLVGAPAGVKPVQVAAQNFDIDPGSSITCNGLAAGPAGDSCPGGVRPVKRGEILLLYLTGQGFITGMPEDGAQWLGGALNTGIRPRVLINTSFVDDPNILYSGLAPALIGVWQINVKVPDNTPPGAVRIAVQMSDVLSSVTTNPYTVIEVK